MRLGVSKIDITPHYPVPLAGFGDRLGVFEGIDSPIYAKVFAFEQQPADARAADRALLVLGDLLWWGPEQMARLRARVKNGWGVDEARVMFSASHSHSGPQTSALTPMVGRPDERYIAWMEEQVFQAVGEAFRKLEPVRAEQGSGNCRVGINRRRLDGGVVRMAPNPDGTLDDRLNVVRFQNEANETTALLVHYTCHPTTTSNNRVSAEYCGHAMERLERELEAEEGRPIIAGFLQGCCGDIRPALIKDGEFYRGDAADVRRLGDTLAVEVKKVLDRPMRELAETQLAGKRIDLSLRLQPMSKNESQPDWHRLMEEEPWRLEPERTLELIRIDLAEGLSLVGMNGEMVVEYGLWVDKVSQGACWPVAYCNGMIGYVPTAAQLAEGGYEATGFIYAFGMPAPYDAACEGAIREALGSLAAADDN